MFSGDNVSAGLLVMLYGLSGVFLVLILFYIVTKLMVVVSSKFASTAKSDD